MRKIVMIVLLIIVHSVLGQKVSDIIENNVSGATFLSVKEYEQSYKKLKSDSKAGWFYVFEKNNLFFETAYQQVFSDSTKKNIQNARDKGVRIPLMLVIIVKRDATLVDIKLSVDNRVLTEQLKKEFILYRQAVIGRKLANLEVDTEGDFSIFTYPFYNPSAKWSKTRSSRLFI